MACMNAGGSKRVEQLIEESCVKVFKLSDIYVLQLHQCDGIT